MTWFDTLVTEQDARGICRRHLVDYYSLSAAGPHFSGSRFESFGENPWNRIVADDLVAVSLLGVDIPAHAALRFLERDAGTISWWLSQVPVDVDLHRSAETDIERGSPGWELWDVLRRGLVDRNRDGLGQVRTSKLLARKRPRLLPVWDRYVKSELGVRGTTDHWSSVRGWLSDERVRTLDELRVEARVPAHVSTLRILDVLLWMRGRSATDHRRQRAGGH